MKVIFLDIDGVLNIWGNMQLGITLDPTRTVLMRLLAETTKARFVISSTWRMHKDCCERLDAAGLPKALIHEDWKTITAGDVRGFQIQDWLERHPEVKQFCIIDDDSDMLEEQMPFFVKTFGMEAGFTTEHFHQALRILQ